MAIKVPFIKHHILNIDSSTKSSYENAWNSNMLYISQYSVMFSIAWIQIQAKPKIKKRE
jgi:hypothetical protein